MPTEKTANVFLVVFFCNRAINEWRYSRIDQVKFVEDSL